MFPGHISRTHRISFPEFYNPATAINIPSSSLTSAKDLAWCQPYSKGMRLGTEVGDIAQWQNVCTECTMGSKVGVRKVAQPHLFKGRPFSALSQSNRIQAGGTLTYIELMCDGECI